MKCSDLKGIWVNIRKVLLGWALYVGATTGVYALLFNGRFGQGGQLPVWLIAAASALAVAAFALLLHWLRGATSKQIPQDRKRDVSGFFWMIVVTGTVGDMLAVAAELAFGAAAVWLMIPVATITYTMCVVWLYRRYFTTERLA